MGCSFKGSLSSSLSLLRNSSPMGIGSWGCDTNMASMSKSSSSLSTGEQEGLSSAAVVVPRNRLEGGVVGVVVDAPTNNVRLLVVDATVVSTSSSFFLAKKICRTWSACRNRLWQNSGSSMAAAKSPIGNLLLSLLLLSNNTDRSFFQSRRYSWNHWRKRILSSRGCTLVPKIPNCCPPKEVMSPSICKQIASHVDEWFSVAKRNFCWQRSLVDTCQLVILTMQPGSNALFMSWVLGKQTPTICSPSETRPKIHSSLSLSLRDNGCRSTNCAKEFWWSKGWPCKPRITAVWMYGVMRLGPAKKLLMIELCTRSSTLTSSGGGVSNQLELSVSEGSVCLDHGGQIVCEQQFCHGSARFGTANGTES